MELFIVGGEWFQTDLVINVIGWVHLGKNFSSIFRGVLELITAEYFREINASVIMSH